MPGEKKSASRLSCHEKKRNTHPDRVVGREKIHLGKVVGREKTHPGKVVRREKIHPGKIIGREKGFISAEWPREKDNKKSS